MVIFLFFTRSLNLPSTPKKLADSSLPGLGVPCIPESSDRLALSDIFLSATFLSPTLLLSDGLSSRLLTGRQVLVLK